jgi:hypothetical protein
MECLTDVVVCAEGHGGGPFCSAAADRHHLIAHLGRILNAQVAQTPNALKNACVEIAISVCERTV